jgi:site-specific DNA recombinase
LLADVEAGKIDAVVVYKVDRLSRSLLDFTKLMEVFDRRQVSFVSVTQQFNTATSMGRLVLNVLLSFAQFEREIISERTRDKIAAARKKGKWSGGLPVLGYDVDPATKKLIVNPAEAERVRAIFGLYLEHESLMPVLKELERRGWANKRWTTRKGKERGGLPFTRPSLHRLLSNPAYAGKVKHKGQAHAGEQAALVDAKVFERTQALLARNGATGGACVRNGDGALLQGLLRCRPCGCAMTPAYTTKQRAKRYRYYVCTNAQSRGWSACPSKSLPAGPIEAFVVERLQALGTDPALLRETLAQLRRADEERLAAIAEEERALKQEAAAAKGETAVLLKGMKGEADASALARLADLQERARARESRATDLKVERDVIAGRALDEPAAAAALAEFAPVWAMLAPKEQARIVALLVENLEYDGAGGKVAVTFRPAGIATLAGELAQQGEG